MTPFFRNPWVWFFRIRKRCGYGVHSPFAFGLLENVVYEKLSYYAFRDLDARLNFMQRFRVRRYLHLLFRLSNYHHPSCIVHRGAENLELDYLLAPCRHARINPDNPDGKILIFLSAPCEEVISLCNTQTMLLLANVHRYREWWDSLPSVVSFDLYDIGIAFFDSKYNKQSYVVNF